jgi:hypothetical protein
VLDEQRLIRVFASLKILKAAGILCSREAGQRRFISIDRDVIQEIVGMLPAGVGAVRKRHRS